ncbi:MAG: hypothetical protein JXJ04_14750 [Spirochaetales bacterium]|nr:hypothetical protein [Spirochaetales bacterium]
MKYEKLLIVFCIANLLFLLISCDTIFIPPYGRVMVKYAMEYEDNSTSIYSGKIKTSTLFLKQDGEIVNEVPLPVIKEHTEGNHLLTSIHIGEYDISIELADGAGKILFCSEDVITINRGDNGEKQMPDFQDFLAILTIVSEDFQAIQGITHADGSLQGDTFIPIDFDFDNQTTTTIDATIPDIYPGDYDIEILVYEGDDVVFSGIKQLTLPRGRHTVDIKELNQKTGWIEITMDSDEVKPEIIEQRIIFTDYYENNVRRFHISLIWKTSYNVMSRICFSNDLEFDYHNELTWGQINWDLGADEKTNEVTNVDFEYNQLHSFVILATDDQGDTTVSDEYNFYFELPPTKACVDKIMLGPDLDDNGRRVEFETFFLASGWSDVSESNWVNMINTWAREVSQEGFYVEIQKYPEDCGCTGNYLPPHPDE